jgi:hypothetical protein
VGAVSWHDDLNGMREAIDGEVSPIDSQDLIEGGIVVHSRKNDCVDVGERLIDVLGEDVASPRMGTSNSWTHLKQVRAAVHQSEDC